MLDITSSDIKPDKKTAVALGLFDGIHCGHRAVLDGALSFREKGLSPGVFTFETETVTTKGNGHLDVILPHDLKEEFFSEMGIEYYCSPDFSEIKDMTATDFVSGIIVGRMNAGAVVCGTDFRFGKGACGGVHELKLLCEPLGIAVMVIPPAKIDGEVISSTLIRRLIREGEMRRANNFLGYDFTLRLPVARGNQLGRTMNFPTINQYLPKEQLVPKFGVYASYTVVDGKEYGSVTNVGVKPTIGGESSPLAETNIFGFEGELYGKTVRVSLTDFIRPEQKFSGLKELSAQMAKDVLISKEIRSNKTV